jgi:hypothetical protein
MTKTKKTTNKRKIRTETNNHNAIGQTPGWRSKISQHWAPDIQRPVTFHRRYSGRLRLKQDNQALQESFNGRLRKEKLSIETEGCWHLK